MTLSGGGYRLCKSEFVQASKKIARRNAQAGNGWTLDMLIGEGNYAATDAQSHYAAGLFPKYKPQLHEPGENCQLGET